MIRNYLNGKGKEKEKVLSIDRYRYLLFLVFSLLDNKK